MACPFPLLLDVEEEATNNIDGQQCAFRCEGTMTSEDELDTYSSYSLALAGIGLLFGSFIFLTWGLFSIKSKQKMTFWVSFSSVGVTSFIFFPGIAAGSIRNVMCKNELEPYRQSDGINACVLQGLSIIFFGNALVLWWFCSCFDLFAKLYLRRRNIGHYLTYYTWVSWGIPTILTLAVLFTGKAGYSQPRLWCLFSPEAPGSFEYIFLYGMIGVLWLIGSILMVLAFYSIVAHAGRAKVIKRLSLYRIPFVFVLLFSFFWAVFFSFTIATDIQEDNYEASAITWFGCLLQGALEVGPDAAFNTDHDAVAFLDPPREDGLQGCGEVQPGRIPPGLYYIALFAFSGNGILVFLVFGTQAQNFKLWYRYISSGFDNASVRPKDAKNANPADYRCTFKELRVKLGSCIAGEKLGDNVGILENSQNRYNVPLLNNDNADYVPQFLTPTSQAIPAASEVTSSSKSQNYPRVSLKPKQPEDPFPTTGNGAPPPNGLNAFYPDGGRESAGREEGNNAPRYNLDDGWSDIYNDPLWGVVEF